MRNTFLEPAAVPFAGRHPWAALCVGLVVALGAGLGGVSPARADAVQTLRDFVRETPSGKSAFTQTVITADGVRKRNSSGTFEFARPNRFRFEYKRPFAQTIVADGQRVWMYDPDLNQVIVRKLAQALGATPAALLAGTDPERDFELKALPAADALEWVQATPRQKDSGLQSLRLGFRGKVLAVLEMVDTLGQRSVLQFTELQTGVRLAPKTFEFTPPAGTDVLEQ